MIHPLKQVFDIVLNLESLEKVEILILERLFAVMTFLVQNIIVHIWDLRITVGKGTIAFLPAEATLDPLVIVDEIGGIILYISNQIRECHDRP
jgi:hypothetical protein